MLAISGGDNFTSRDDREWKRQSHFLWEMMGAAGWDFSAVQSTDLLMGVDVLKATAEKTGINLLCSNLVDAAGQPLFAGHAIMEFDGKRLGLLSVIEPEEQNARERIDPSLEFTDSKTAILDGVRELRETCDAVVLLYGGRRITVMERCKDVEGLDLIFYGMASSSERMPLLTDMGTPVYSAASRGKEFGEIRLTFKDGGGVELSPFTVHDLKIELKEDPYIAARVEEFLAVANRRKEGTQEIRTALAEASETTVFDTYVGADRCTICHGDLVDSYMAGPHVQSYEKLVELFQENNPDCVSCHVTGWKVPGGFAQASSAKRDLDRVQCEACHGYGTAHVRDGSMLTSARESCVRCHNSDMPTACGSFPKPFDYDGYRGRIEH